MIEIIVAAVVGFAAGYAVHYFSKGKTKASIEERLNDLKDRVDK